MFSKNIISYICVIASKCLYGNSTAQLIVNTLHLDDGTNVQKIHSPHSCENCHFKTETEHIIRSTYKLPKFCYFRIKSKTHNHGQRGLTWSNLSLPHLFSLSPWPFPLKKKKKKKGLQQNILRIPLLNRQCKQFQITWIFKVCFYPYAILHEPNLCSEALVFPLAREYLAIPKIQTSYNLICDACMNTDHRDNAKALCNHLCQSTENGSQGWNPSLAISITPTTSDINF